MNLHLSQDELLDQMYGVGDEEDHLRECAECSGRFEAMRQRRVDATPEPVVSTEFLASQRRAIYARVDRGLAAHVRWVPAFAVAGLLAMGLFLSRPHSEYRALQAPDTAAITELSSQEQLVSDLYLEEQSVEPRATAPIHELFEESAGPEEQ